jgi:hypothetical protein
MIRCGRNRAGNCNRLCALSGDFPLLKIRFDHVSKMV